MPVDDEAGDLAVVGTCAVVFGEEAVLLGAGAGTATGDFALDLAGAGAGAAIETELKYTKAKTKQRSAMNRAILFLGWESSTIISCDGNFRSSISSSQMNTTGMLRKEKTENVWR